MGDISLVLQPVVQRISIEVRPPPALHAQCAQLPVHQLTLRCVQEAPRIRLTLGPQVGIPGAACLPDSRSNPVFSYANGRLSQITYADGSTRTFSYDSQNRLASLADTFGSVTRTKTFLYDSLNNLTSISAS